jgi:hypothetical protein
MTTADTPWDTEWAAQKAAEALRYLGRNFPECLENLRVASLDEHETAADEAAIRGDEDAYLKALREPTCEPAGTRPCGFVEERHDGPSGRARPRAEGEEKGQGGRLATGTRYRRILIIQWISQAIISPIGSAAGK